MRLENRLRAAACNAAALLPAEARRRLVEEAATAGYTGREIAEMMGVSPAAVSRYLHGSLSPSPEALCRLVQAIDEEALLRLVETEVREVWKHVTALVDALAETAPEKARRLAEEMADDITSLLLKTTRTRSQATRNP